MSKVTDIFDCAIDLLKDPKHWTRGAFARREDHFEVSYTSPDAVSYCMAGALRHCCADETTRYYEDKVRPYLQTAIRKHQPGLGITEFNDTIARHEDVLALLDEAKALAESS